MVGTNVGCQCLVGFIDIYCLSMVQMSLDSEPKTSTWAQGAGAMRWFLLLYCGGHCFNLACMMYHFAPPPAYLDTLLRGCLRGRLDASLRPVDGLHFLYDELL
jgi:hypothetical protein